MNVRAFSQNAKGQKMQRRKRLCMRFVQVERGRVDHANDWGRSRAVRLRSVQGVAADVC